MVQPEDGKVFPQGMEPLGKGTFQFACHPGLACFMACCRRQELILYPYDVLRLKKALGLSSGELLERHTVAGRGANPYFPTLFLRMADNAEHTCPFLGEGGCTVYEDRPTACRTYPLERAVDRSPGRGQPRDHYFLKRHPYCLGHGEDRSWTVRDWLRDQRLLDFNTMNDLWTEMDTLFAGNPWQGEGAYGPRQKVAFMVCYNLDLFRIYLADHQILESMRLSRRERQELAGDEALLRFGFRWLRGVLAA
ncbi:MAG: YkgJ family cysteine cluster protein [Thermodesulfobacteriota bacterium]